jgi:hypothetical protein
MIDCQYPERHVTEEQYRLEPREPFYSIGYARIYGFGHVRAGALAVLTAAI